MAITLRGNTYWIRLRPGPGLPRIERSLGTSNEKEAQKRHDEIEKAIWRDKLIVKAPTAPVVPSLEDIYTRALTEHFKGQKGAEGVPARWANLERFIDTSVPITEVTAKTGRALISAMREGTWSKVPGGPQYPYTSATINRHLALLSKLSKLASEWEDTPLQRIPKLAESDAFKRRPVKPEEEDAIVAALKAHQNPRWAAYGDLFTFLAVTGCRLGEVVDTPDWSWVDLEAKTITLWDTKNGGDVTKPLSGTAVAILEAQIGSLRPFEFYVETTMRKAWDWACTEIGMTDRKRVVPHSLRHAAATRLLEAGHDVVTVKNFMGHKAIATTMRYTHLSAAHLRSAGESLDRQKAAPNPSPEGAPPPDVPAGPGRGAE